MELETQISLMTVPQEFTRLCNAVLQAEHGNDFVAIDDDRPDAGNDGYLKSEGRMFAVHCFKRAQNQSLDRAIKTKAIGDLGKAIALKQAGLWDVRAWTFISNYQIPESIARQLLAIGSGAGIDVAWQGAPFIARGLQHHPDLRAQFPALQVNEINETLDELRSELHEQRPRVSSNEFGVPRTRAEIEAVLRDRPLCWEYRLFAGLLNVGLQEMDFKWRDFDLGTTDREPVELRAAECPDYIGGLFSRVSAIIDPMMRPFDPDVQERAFGAPGEHGDPGGIEYFAKRILIAYEAMLDWAADVRAVQAEEPFDRLIPIAPGYVQQSIVQVRTFVARLCSQLEQALAALAQDEPPNEPIVIEVDLTLEIDPAVSAAFERELRRARRKLRWGF